MYLNRLESKETKELAILLAYFVAAATQEEEADESYHDFDLYGSNMREEIKEICEKSGQWGVSSHEQSVIDQIYNEMNMDTVYTTSQRHDYLVRNLFTEKALTKAWALLSEEDFTEEQARKTLLKCGIKEAIKEKESDLSVIDKKIILFETMAVAYADSEFTTLEQHAVNCIADSFDLERELIDDFIGIADNFAKVYADGLSIIEE
ncbi:hypothetical protein [Halodesulfovibrio sp.]|uniref:hypothetical protein n=1 Tax=Halodesulfovibrio sp. TaxID=1912772 RepID=UPI0025BA5A2A|nr:hypothetical protein [Halodesulfovibrio sp.]